MLKKFVQQDRRRIETGGVPSGYAESLNDVRTPQGTRRVSARQGWEGEKSDFFSILLNRLRSFVIITG